MPYISGFIVYTISKGHSTHFAGDNAESKLEIGLSGQRAYLAGMGLWVPSLTAYKTG